MMMMMMMMMMKKMIMLAHTIRGLMMMTVIEFNTE